ncbi:rhodopsin kinase GRK1-like [Salvelinus namaycush]|uniref:Rhodopsin kinase GRK1-like n=1 Tax=Salvelinus namaycush TaxID=8040 RepID=A0A8U1F5P4_SALNM|nr:rhodopsin kinase GRK1-like [Salvelinus namaycush]
MIGMVVYPETFSENGKSICSGLLEKQLDQRLGFKNGACDEIGAHPFSGIHWRRLDAGHPTAATKRLHVRSTLSRPMKFPVQGVDLGTA